MTKFKPWAEAQVVKPANRVEMAKARVTFAVVPRELALVEFPVRRAVRSV